MSIFGISQQYRCQQLPSLHPKPNRSPAQRVRFGKEEQRRERALTFAKKNRSKRYKACSDLVPVVGLEPTRCRHQRILSPSRLPFHHTGENSCLLYRKQNRNSREISITSGAFKKEHHREDETGNGVVQKWRENRERGYTNQGKRAIIHKLQYLKRRARGQRDETDMADSASDRTADPFDWADRRL